MKSGDTVKCIKKYVFNSFPDNFISNTNDILIVEGFIYGDLVLRVNKKSAFIISKKDFNEHFKPVNMDITEEKDNVNEVLKYL